MEHIKKGTAFQIYAPDMYTMDLLIANLKSTLLRIAEKNGYTIRFDFKNNRKNHFAFITVPFIRERNLKEICVRVTIINDNIKVTKKGNIKITKIGYFFDCQK